MNIKKIVLMIALVTAPVIITLAEGPGGPGSGSNGNGTPVGNGGNPVGANAPVGSGLVFMLIYGGAYGAKKVFSIRKKKE